MYAKICPHPAAEASNKRKEQTHNKKGDVKNQRPHPAAGTLEIAANPLGTSANFNPADGLK